MFIERVAQLLITTYKNLTVYAGEDHESALHGAVESALSPFQISDERKADLYARLDSQWSEYPAGVQRRIYVNGTVMRWNIDHRLAGNKLEKK